MTLADKALAYIKAHPSTSASYLAKKYNISSSYAYKLKALATGKEDWFVPAPVPAPEPAPQTALDVQVGGDHYKKLKIQPIAFIHANNIPFIEGNIIKYITRWREKNGVKDLEKVKHYVELLIELEGLK
jgi:hypothetical protein